MKVLGTHLLVAALVYAGTLFAVTDKDSKIERLMLQKKLSECAVGFGSYIATKGKYGSDFFRLPAELPRTRLANQQ